MSMSLILPARVYIILIEDLEEARDMGLDDYLDSGRRCLMEWSDRVEPLLPDDLTVVTIEEQPDGTRRLTVSNE